MVIALLVCLAATVTTGLIAYGEEGKGPLAAVLVTDANANGNEAEHRALAKTGEQSESTIGELHGLLANHRGARGRARLWRSGRQCRA
jgi:hypothetical protein